MCVCNFILYNYLISEHINGLDTRFTFYNEKLLSKRWTKEQKYHISRENR